MAARRLAAGLLRVLLALVLPGLAGAAPTAAPASTPLPGGAAASQHERGRAVYNFRCYFCHGYSGDARTLAASYLQPPPRDFTASRLGTAEIARALREGRPGTAMKSFARVLGNEDIEAVAAFVRREFVQDRARNTAYHTAANGWPGHERHAAAFPFARGEIALDTASEQLSPAQRAGRKLFLETCISCHDRGRVIEEGPAWSARPLSYPRMGFVPGQPNTPPVDAVSSASVYAKHEVQPRITGLTAQQRHGERLFSDNCAFCHGGDGTGKNWIGQFMEPKARDLTQYTPRSMPPALLAQRIREGLPGTSMPAWQHVLSKAEVEALVAYVSRAFLRPEAGPPAAPRP
ncbi:Cytochrome c class I [Rubrivivax sp. A210]|uniref:c-type cytochrome n=1 Tax=Rubrivivax sp. A210 TaxID=2772301 RepID=UPI00191A856F|nr:c-type cytochrome [Rubrivivax sp. A210]CAD5372319.1 Cytochrome c class I [Rubrivivax sp. A210]